MESSLIKGSLILLLINHRSSIISPNEIPELKSKIKWFRLENRRNKHVINNKSNPQSKWCNSKLNKITLGLWKKTYNLTHMIVKNITSKKRDYFMV